MTGKIPHVRLSIGEAEIDAVTEVLRSGHLAMGPVTAELEKEIAKQSNQEYVVAVNSGTAALHVALLALGVKTGDEVIIPDYSCQALLNAVKYVGAEARLVDIDLDTFNIDPAEARRSINSKTRAIIVPHMFGLMADMPAIRALGVPVIEDCAMGLGAKLNGALAGSFGDISIFSFYATKMIAAGEGGAVATSKKEFADAVRDVREYDKKKEYKVRYNYKLSDVQAAIALAQLRRLSDFVAKRQKLARRYAEGLKGTSFVLPTSPEGYEHAFSRYVVRADDEAKVREYLKKNGVEAGSGVVFGIHELIDSKETFPKSEEALRTAVSLPMYPTLAEEEQDTVIKLLCEY